jgi:hypothetical protein
MLPPPHPFERWLTALRYRWTSRMRSRDRPICASPAARMDRYALRTRPGSPQADHTPGLVHLPDTHQGHEPHWAHTCSLPSATRLGQMITSGGRQSADGVWLVTTFSTLPQGRPCGRPPAAAVLGRLHHDCCSASTLGGWRGLVRTATAGTIVTVGLWLLSLLLLPRWLNSTSWLRTR